MMTSVRMALGVLGVAAAGLMVVAAGDRPEESDGRLRVAVSVPPQAWLVEQLGGEHVAVHSIISGTDSPHSYRPSDSQIAGLMRTAVFFRIGAPFERGPWFQAIRKNSRSRLVDVRQGISLRDSDGRACNHPGHHNHDVAHQPSKDPHIWTSPRLLKVQARTVVDVLRSLDAEHRQDYEQRLDVLLQRLDELDSAIRNKLSPYQGRAFFVFHPAWSYFAEEYGLRQIAIQIEGKEPTDFELTELQRIARREGIKTVFVQPQISGQSAKAVAEVVGAELAILDPMARDIPANLRGLADMIVASFKD